MKTDPVFESYLANIKAKTGKTPADFKALAKKMGLLRPGVKAGEIVAWLKKDFDLGHGHAMAIYAVLKPEINQAKARAPLTPAFAHGDSSTTRGSIGTGPD